MCPEPPYGIQRVLILAANTYTGFSAEIPVASKGLKRKEVGGRHMEGGRTEKGDIGYIFHTIL